MNTATYITLSRFLLTPVVVLFWQKVGMALDQYVTIFICRFK